MRMKLIQNVLFRPIKIFHLYYDHMNAYSLFFSQQIQLSYSRVLNVISANLVTFLYVICKLSNTVSGAYFFVLYPSCTSRCVVLSRLIKLRNSQS